MKVAVYSSKEYDISSFSTAGKKYDIEYKFFEGKLTTDSAVLAKGYDAVCIFVNDDCNEEVVEALAKVDIRLIALRCAGYNNVDVKACQKFGIKVVRVPAYSPYAVAEHAMALLLTSIRRIHKAYIRTRDYNFSLKGLTGFDLHGKTVGVIGTGKIGKIFANICQGFGMKILGYDKFPAQDFVGQYVDLDTLLKESDIISLHCPLLPDTYHLINKDTIAKMKKGVAIINTSRGSLINAEDLLNAVKDRHVGTVCLDVYEEESELFFNDYSGHILNDDILARLISMPNVIVTSHQAFLTEEALENIADTTSLNIISFIKDNVLQNEVTAK